MRVPQQATNPVVDSPHVDDDGAVGEDGQGLVEYALILMLIAVVVIVIVAVLGNQTSNLYSNVSSGFRP